MHMTFVMKMHNQNTHTNLVAKSFPSLKREARQRHKKELISLK